MLQKSVWRSITLLVAMVFFTVYLSACASTSTGGLSKAFDTSATIKYYPMNKKSLSAEENMCLAKINKQRVAENKIPVTAVNGSPHKQTASERASQKALSRGAAYGVGSTVGMFALPILAIFHGSKVSDHESFEIDMKECLQNNGIAVY